MDIVPADDILPFPDIVPAAGNLSVPGIVLAVLHLVINVLKQQRTQHFTPSLAGHEFVKMSAFYCLPRRCICSYARIGDVCILSNI